MEQKLSNINNFNKWTKPFRACAVIVGLLLIALIVLLFVVLKNPAIHDMAICKIQVMEIKDAIGRFVDFNDKYPANLNELKKEYLKDKSILKCPLDKSGSKEASYTYHAPKLDASDNFVVLECDRHKIMRALDYSKIQLLKSGEIILINPPAKINNKKTK